MEKNGKNTSRVSSQRMGRILQESLLKGWEEYFKSLFSKDGKNTSRVSSQRMGRILQESLLKGWEEYFKSLFSKDGKNTSRVSSQRMGRILQEYFLKGWKNTSRVSSQRMGRILQESLLKGWEEYFKSLFSKDGKNTSGVSSQRMGIILQESLLKGWEEYFKSLFSKDGKNTSRVSSQRMGRILQESLLKGWEEYFKSLFSKDGKNTSRVSSQRMGRILQESLLKGWEEYFNSLFSKDENNTNLPIINSSPPNLEHNKSFTMQELKNLKNNKACGSDSIPNEFIKHATDEFLEVILTFLNLNLRKGIAASDWCLDLISPIHKAGPKENTGNYRGICVMNSLLKILCSLMNERLTSFSSKFNLINKEQIGFQKNARTSDHLLTLKTVVNKYVSDKKVKKLYTCFIDFKKAFDSIWHEGLFYKLENKGIHGNFLKLLQNIYSKTMFTKSKQKNDKLLQL